MDNSDDRFWEDLLFPLEDGTVVPIVGRDLLEVPTATGPRLFHNIVAEKLAGELHVDTTRLRANYDCNDVICADEKFHGNASSRSTDVVRILKTTKVPIPESLRLLAEIPAFKTFVSATYDTLLEEAIKSVRGRAPATASFPAASGNTDFDRNQLEQNGSFVFQILGRASASSNFGLTEGLVLEQMHDLMTGTGRPAKLIRHLQENHLLILGVSFPDWLSRFLLRLARTKPLWDDRSIMEVIAEHGADQTLSLFLRRFSPDRSRVYPGNSPVDFVRELHRRWFERHPLKEPEPGEETPQYEPVPEPIVPGSIFVSYASQDRQAAMRLADGLKAKNLEVWIDERLLPGMKHWPIIERNIRESSAFVAVLSQNTLGDEKRAFRHEWDEAYKIAPHYFGTSLDFIFPVAVDATSAAQLTAPMQKVFGTSLSRISQDGNAPPELVTQLTAAQQRWRRQNRR